MAMRVTNDGDTYLHMTLNQMQDSMLAGFDFFRVAMANLRVVETENGHFVEFTLDHLLMIKICVKGESIFRILYVTARAKREIPSVSQQEATEDIEEDSGESDVETMIGDNHAVAAMKKVAPP
jgi:hypothetical protein